MIVGSGPKEAATARPDLMAPYENAGGPAIQVTDLFQTDTDSPAVGPIDTIR